MSMDHTDYVRQVLFQPVIIRHILANVNQLDTIVNLYALIKQEKLNLLHASWIKSRLIKRYLELFCFPDKYFHT